MHLGRADVDGGGGEVGQLQCSWEMCSQREMSLCPPRRGQPPPCRGNGRQKAPQKHPQKAPSKKHPQKAPAIAALRGGSSTGSGQGASAGSPPGPSHGTAFMASPRPKPPLLAEQSIESQPGSRRQGGLCLCSQTGSESALGAFSLVGAFRVLFHGTAEKSTRRGGKAPEKHPAEKSTRVLFRQGAFLLEPAPRTGPPVTGAAEGA